MKMGAIYISQNELDVLNKTLDVISQSMPGFGIGYIFYNDLLVKLNNPSYWGRHPEILWVYHVPDPVGGTFSLSGGHAET